MWKDSYPPPSQGVWPSVSLSERACLGTVVWKAAQTSQHERERTQVTGKEKWRGDTQEEGLLPKAGGCGIKGEKKQKPHNPIPQIPVELVGVGWEYSSGRKEKPKRNSTEGVWEGAGLLACLGLDFYRWRVFSVATIRQSCAFSL